MPGQGQAGPRPALLLLLETQVGGAAASRWWQLSSDDINSALAWNTRLLGSIDIM